MDKPVAAIEQLRAFVRCQNMRPQYAEAILAYIDSIPEGAVPVVWPKGLTRAFLMDLADALDSATKEEALRALAAIAPERKKRGVNLWRIVSSDQNKCLYEKPLGWTPDKPTPWWECVVRNVELED